jgi:hypothetical protein
MPALFVAQLLFFMGQETVESLVAGGGHLPSAVELLFWGAFGQLPAAAAAAVVLTWLLARLDAAWTAIAAGRVGLSCQDLTLALAGVARCRPAPARWLDSTFPLAFGKRGPPLRSNP